MAPRLSHKKSRLGCKRCKTRKVKCDEARPRCTACTRHDVPCEYPTFGSAYSTIAYSEVSSNGHGDRKGDPLTELRLMHEWVAYVCESLPTWEFWKYKAPLVAFKYRYILDAMLAISALHHSRHQPRIWMPLEGKMVTHRPNIPDPTTPATPDVVNGVKSNGWTVIRMLAAEANPDGIAAEDTSVDPIEMLMLARQYFDDAIEGYRRAIQDPGPNEMQGLYECSVLVGHYSMFILSEDTDSNEAASHHPIHWFRISRGSLHIIMQWQNNVGPSWATQAGGLYGHPDLSDDDALFKPEFREPFKYILAPVGEDMVTDTDRQAYEETLSYVGLIYKGIVEGTDTVTTTCRFVMAMPSRVSIHFSELVENNQPRAYVVITHMFAMLRLISDEYPWFHGIAERQVPILCKTLPPAWHHSVEWPLRVASGEKDLKPPS